MSEKIQWTLSVQAEKGPKISASDTLTVDAYDKFDITVTTGTTKTLALQPSTDVTKIDLILIKPDKPSDTLTYTINTKDPVTESITLDALQLLMGGAVGLYGEAPTSLVFKNDSTNDVSIQVLVGRIATS